MFILYYNHLIKIIFMFLKKLKTRVRRYSNPKRLWWRLQVGKSKFALYSYKDSSGDFDYNKYKTIQAAGNKGKLHLVNDQKEDVEFLSSFITSVIPTPTFGICHGTRRGDEQVWFSEYVNCEVIGTEISETAKDFPKTVQWDFHDENPDWEGNADFVYSNSFDHSYDPGKALTNWMKTLKPGGVCIIEHSLQQSPAATSELDPFGATLDIMPFLILQWSQGKYSVRSIIESTYVEEKFGAPRTYLIIQNN